MQFKFYDYLVTLRIIIKTDGTLLNFKQYAAFGKTTLDTLGVTRQGYIGKEKDVENNLGDHGVRKYDYNGRFNSIDI